jgi:hypothetical protein
VKWFGQSKLPFGSLFSRISRFISVAVSRLKEFWSHPVEWTVQPGLLIFDFVSAQFQVQHEPAPARKPRQKSKGPALNGYSIL